MKGHGFTARDLAGLFRVPLDRVKRWSREFLPPDPEAGRHMGRARIFSESDAFVLFLGGYLLNRMGVSITRAKAVIQDMGEWLRENGFWPGSDENPLHTEIYITPPDKEPGAFHYTVKERRSLETEDLKKPGRPGSEKIWVERYVTYEPILPGGHERVEHIRLPRSPRDVVLPITILIWAFRQVIPEE